jgi:hypothetical protein
MLKVEMHHTHSQPKQKQERIHAHEIVTKEHEAKNPEH